MKTWFRVAVGSVSVRLRACGLAAIGWPQDPPSEKACSKLASPKCVACMTLTLQCLLLQHSTVQLLWLRALAVPPPGPLLKTVCRQSVAVLGTFEVHCEFESSYVHCVHHLRFRDISAPIPHEHSGKTSEVFITCLSGGLVSPMCVHLARWSD